MHCIHANEFPILCHVTNDFWRSKFLVIKNMVLWQNIWFVDIQNYINAFQLEHIKFTTRLHREHQCGPKEKKKRRRFSQNTENELFLMSQSFTFILFFACLNSYAHNCRYLNTQTHTLNAKFSIYTWKMTLRWKRFQYLGAHCVASI